MRWGGEGVLLMWCLKICSGGSNVFRVFCRYSFKMKVSMALAFSAARLSLAFFFYNGTFKATQPSRHGAIAEPKTRLYFCAAPSTSISLHLGRIVPCEYFMAKHTNPEHFLPSGSFFLIVYYHTEVPSKLPGHDAEEHQCWFGVFHTQYYSV